MSLAQFRILLPTDNEKTSQSLSYQSSDIITIQIELFKCVDAIFIVSGIIGIISHSIAHSLCNVLYDGSVFLVDFAELLDYNVKFNEELSICLVGTVYPLLPSFKG
jgi:hypothetical protein